MLYCHKTQAVPSKFVNDGWQFLCVPMLVRCSSRFWNSSKVPIILFFYCLKHSDFYFANIWLFVCLWCGEGGKGEGNFTFLLDMLALYVQQGRFVMSENIQTAYIL